jgi:hypothetical protein
MVTLCKISQSPARVNNQSDEYFGILLFFTLAAVSYTGTNFNNSIIVV